MQFGVRQATRNLHFAATDFTERHCVLKIVPNQPK